jgi:uncharacterized protein YbaP (TraB family)
MVIVGALYFAGEKNIFAALQRGGLHVDRIAL